MVFGLTIIASVAGKSLTKGLIAGVFGLMIAVVGIDPIVGYARYSFDIPNLMTGFPLLPVLIGLFALSQVFSELEKTQKAGGADTPPLGNLLPTVRELLGLMKTIVPASLIGTLIGVIPGTGGAIASFLAYNEARRFSKHPEKFGTGCLEGVAAPEAANNGTTGGAMVPTLTLGIPGDVVTAVMLGALMLIGVRPGPLLFKDSPEIINAVYAGLLMSNVLILLLGFATVRLFPMILRVPSAILFPLVLALCFVGSFSLSNSSYDMTIALAFGVLGYFMRKHGFPAAPVVLGVILGPIAEDVLGRALITAHGDWMTLFRSPIALFFYVISVASVAYSVRRAPGSVTD
jgi:putative tricarboxylic transport membrane protein